MTIDLQALANLQATYEASGNSAPVGNFHGHSVQVVPTDQLRINSEVVHSLLTKAFGEETSSTAHLSKLDSLCYEQAKAIFNQKLEVSDHPLSGHEIAAALGDVVKLLTRTESIRELTKDFVKDKFQKAGLTEIPQMEAFDLEGLDLEAMASLQDKQISDKTAQFNYLEEHCSAQVDTMIKTCKNIRNCKWINPSMKDFLMRSSLDTPYCAQPAAFDALQRIMEQQDPASLKDKLAKQTDHLYDLSGLKELLTNPDDFSFDDKAIIFDSLLNMLSKDESFSKDMPHQNDVQQLAFLVMASLVSKEPELASGFISLARDMPQILKAVNDRNEDVQSTIQLNIQNVRDNVTWTTDEKRALETNLETYAAQENAWTSGSYKVARNVQRLAAGLARLDDEIKASINEFQDSLNLGMDKPIPGPLLHDMNMDRIRSFLFKEINPADWKKRLASLEDDFRAGYHAVCNHPTLPNTTKAWCIKTMLQFPDQFDFKAMMKVSDVALDALKEKFGCLLEATNGIPDHASYFTAFADFASQFNDQVNEAFKKSSKMDLDALKADWCRNMLIQLLAGSSDEFKDFVLDIDGNLTRMLGLLNAEYKNAKYHDGAQEAIKLILSARNVLISRDKTFYLQNPDGMDEVRKKMGDTWNKVSADIRADMKDPLRKLASRKEITRDDLLQVTRETWGDQILERTLKSKNIPDNPDLTECSKFLQSASTSYSREFIDSLTNRLGDLSGNKNFSQAFGNTWGRDALHQDGPVLTEARKHELMSTADKFVKLAQSYYAACTKSLASLPDANFSKTLIEKAYCEKLGKGEPLTPELEKELASIATGLAEQEKNLLGDVDARLDFIAQQKGLKGEDADIFKNVMKKLDEVVPQFESTKLKFVGEKYALAGEDVILDHILCRGGHGQPYHALKNQEEKTDYLVASFFAGSMGYAMTPAIRIMRDLQHDGTLTPSTVAKALGVDKESLGDNGVDPGACTSIDNLRLKMSDAVLLTLKMELTRKSNLTALELVSVLPSVIAIENAYPISRKSIVDCIVLHGQTVTNKMFTDGISIYDSNRIPTTEKALEDWCHDFGRQCDDETHASVTIVNGQEKFTCTNDGMDLPEDQRTAFHQCQLYTENMKEAIQRMTALCTSDGKRNDLQLAVLIESLSQTSFCETFLRFGAYELTGSGSLHQEHSALDYTVSRESNGDILVTFVSPKNQPAKACRLDAAFVIRQDGSSECRKFQLWPGSPASKG